MQEFLDLSLHRIRTLLRTDLANAIVFARRSYRLFAFPLRVRQRLFDVYILTSLHGPNRCEAMPVVRCSNDNCVDLFVIDQLA